MPEGLGQGAGPRAVLPISVLLSSYEQPAWLERCLRGYARQTHDEFEILVADDGSGPRTAETVDRLRRDTGLEIRHLWHEDRGFRKCEILNHAIRAARGEYLLFSDGDCVPREDFVAAHARLAAPGRFLSGGALRLPRRTSERVTPEAVEAGRPFELGWLLRHGWRPGHRLLRLTRSGALAALLDLATPTRATFNGGNASMWRAAALEANGFDARMGYGGEDRELGERLRRLGLRGKQVRHRAVLVHLWHERPYAGARAAGRNERLRRRARERGATRAVRGIDELGPPCLER